MCFLGHLQLVLGDLYADFYFSFASPKFNVKIRRSFFFQCK